MRFTLSTIVIRQEFCLNRLCMIKQLSDIEKITESLLLFYGRVDGPMAEKMEKIIWFYSCGKGTEDTATCSVANEKPVKRIYSFAHDAEYIYAAFWSQYGIDLQKWKTCIGGSS